MIHHPGMRHPELLLLLLLLDIQSSTIYLVCAQFSTNHREFIIYQSINNSPQPTSNGSNAGCGCGSLDVSTAACQSICSSMHAALLPRASVPSVLYNLLCDYLYAVCILYTAVYSIQIHGIGVSVSLYHSVTLYAYCMTECGV